MMEPWFGQERELIKASRHQPTELTPPTMALGRNFVVKPTLFEGPVVSQLDRF